MQTSESCEKIAESWGTPLFVDEDPNETVSIGRVCIKTNIHGHVNENCKVIILGKSYNVSVKEFAEWAPDIKTMDTTSCNNSETDKSEKLEDDLCENGPLDKEEGTKQDNFSFEHLTSPLVKTAKEDSSSISKPPGFEAYNSNNKRFSFGGNRQSPKQPSHFSSAPAKSSRVSKSQTKSFGNHGSMIEAFVSHIEMGKVLGYDMEGSKNDLKKFIDSLGAKQGIWIASRIHCFMINVYAPQDDSKKEKLWNDIFDFMNSNRGHHLIFGDFNVVRFASERFGTAFNHASANVFNQFIRDAHLWDIPLGGHLFTRFNKHGDKLSKLDRPFCSPLCQMISAFKFYNSWLLDKSLHSTITDFWDNYSPMNHANPIVSFKNKMKALKVVIKDWNLKRKGSLTREKEDLTKKIKDFDANIVTRSTDFSVDFHRASWIDRLRDIDLKENIDASQKAKIKWGIEADENSKFFHAIVNQKRRYLSIQGIKVEGLWIEDPTDDALLIGEWSRNNIKSLVSILDCFHHVSGLKINYHKSNLFGVGVPLAEVASLASITGCNALGSPFNYLGLPIDCNMALVKSWDPIIDKFSKCLSKWKASLLSIGGRATLITSVLGAIGTYFFSLFPMPLSVNKKLESIRSNFFWGSDGNFKKIPWISWNLALASKEKGGLGIGSLYSLNHALIQKWRWRFLHNPHALWSRLIVAIHGPNEGSSSFFSHIKSKGVWNRIVGSINIMHEKGFIPHSSMQRRVNNGISTKFWYDTWAGTFSLKQQFPRLFRLALNKDASVRDCWNNGWHLVWSRNVSNGSNANLLTNLLNLLQNTILNDSDDLWVWYSGNSTFIVKDARGKIDDGFLPDDGLETRWNRDWDSSWFDSLTTKEKFLNHSGIGSWFTELIQATSSFENDERIVWISIEGLPIKAWTPNTFRKIASLGEVCGSGR
ncbi:RNA-directed DNA polymerase, eukaryota, reverse transcriptase zinc-binding domain protein [Tanacetum coccineum]